MATDPFTCQYECCKCLLTKRLSGTGSLQPKMAYSVLAAPVNSTPCMYTQPARCAGMLPFVQGVESAKAFLESAIADNERLSPSQRKGAAAGRDLFKSNYRDMLMFPDEAADGSGMKKFGQLTDDQMGPQLVGVLEVGVAWLGAIMAPCML
jgi:hypothetical protein